MTENDIGTVIVRSALEVHKKLGPGLLESSYQTCLYHELIQTGLNVQKEASLPVIYKGLKMECGYRIDLWVNNKVIIETKSVDALNDIHFAQLLTYLKLSDNRLGYLINFNVLRVKDGIRRVVNNI
jgi:GxxExxY protein